MAIRVNRPRTTPELLSEILERLRRLENETTDHENRLAELEAD